MTTFYTEARIYLKLSQRNYYIFDSLTKFNIFHNVEKFFYFFSKAASFSGKNVTRTGIFRDFTAVKPTTKRATLSSSPP